jgi:hypothetical protein
MQEDKKNYRKDELSDQIDSEKDRKEMETEISSIDMPDVNDIPGQEGFVPPAIGELADTTVSSADEEGEGIFDEDINEELNESADSEVSKTEKEDLQKSANDMPGDDENLREAALDSTDEDGTPLNEGSFDRNITPSDLDIPGADLDDDEESIGEEDEENNDYSLGGDDDDIPQDDF